jgi:predicted dehydrogenase/flavin reductase (DIM6/NTAB) family NADH-FMN oxidoreductase RutF
MRLPAQTIWDTGIQCVCGVVSARAEHGFELFLSGNFGQAGLEPARIAVNPNRLYPIEQAIRGSRRFAINLLPATAALEAARLMAIRRREPRKAAALGWQVAVHELDIPFLPWAVGTLFCELEDALDTGDHSLMIGRVVASQDGSAKGSRPLLFGDALGARTPQLARRMRGFVAATGAIEAVRLVYNRLRPPSPPNLARATYEAGGHTEAELRTGLTHGVVDTGRRLALPRSTQPHGKSGVCIVGVGAWGAFYSELARRAAPDANLFLCGRDEQRTARAAHALKAQGYFTDIERAIADPRVQALVLVLPHDEHRSAVEMVVGAGKHALVEKPIATTLEDANAMIAAARRAGVVFMVAEDMHFRPTVLEAARRISLGDIGEPLYLLIQGGGIMRRRGWKADPIRAGGGVLMDIGVHYVRAMRLLMGEAGSVIASRAMQVDTHSGVEDSAQLLFGSDAGWEAHMLLSWASTRGHAPDIVIAGDCGTLHLWPGTPVIDYYLIAPRTMTRLLEYVRPRVLQRALSRPTAQRIRTRMRNAEGTGHADGFRAFLGAIEGQGLPDPPATEGRRDLEIILKSYEALQLGSRIQITTEEV